MANTRFLQDLTRMVTESFPWDQSVQDSWDTLIKSNQAPLHSKTVSGWGRDTASLQELLFKPRSTPSTEKEEAKEQSEEDFIPTISW